MSNDDETTVHFVRPVKEMTDEERARLQRWDSLALVWGYNEMAKEAGSLGEKVFCRMARDAAAEQLRALGVEVKLTPGSPTVMTLGERPPFITFQAADIEAMRAVVAEFDAKFTVGEAGEETG